MRLNDKKHAPRCQEGIRKCAPGKVLASVCLFQADGHCRKRPLGALDVTANSLNHFGVCSYQQRRMHVDYVCYNG